MNQSEAHIYTLFMQYMPAFVGAVIATALLFWATKYVLRNYPTIQIAGYIITKLFAGATGWALLIVSASMNYAFTVGMMKGFPEWVESATYMGMLMGAVNLSAGWAVTQMIEAKQSGDKKAYIAARTKWGIIVTFSLLTASTVLFTGHQSIGNQIELSQDQQAINAARVAQNEARMANIKVAPNTNAAALGAGTMTNSNGTKVSIARHCKPNSWYAVNRPACGNYLLALANSGAVQKVDELTSQNIALAQANLDAKNAQPVQFIPNLFGVELPPKVAFFFMAIVIEVAAEICLIISMTLKPPSLTNLQGSVGGTARDLKGSGELGSSQGSVKKGRSENLKPQEKTPPLVGKDESFMLSIGTDPMQKIPDELLSDFIYQLSIRNPDARINANELNDTLKKHRGEGIGKPRWYALLEAEDVVLTEGVKPHRVYKFRRTDASHDDSTAEAGATGLPTSQSVLRQDGSEDRRHRTGT